MDLLIFMVSIVAISSPSATSSPTPTRMESTSPGAPHRMAPSGSSRGWGRGSLCLLRR